MMPAMVVVPTPVTVMPMMVVPVAVMVPVYFFRLDTIDIALRYDGGFGCDARRACLQLCRYRRQRCRLCACGEQYAACHESHRKFQNVPAFHDFSPFLEMERGQTVSPSQDECSLNSLMAASTGA